MLTYKELVIKANNSQMEELISRMFNKSVCVSKWNRKEDGDQSAIGYSKNYIFQREESDGQPNAELIIICEEANLSWCVVNVVPGGEGRFCHQQYNDILTDFYNLVVKALAGESNIEVNITSGNVTASDLLGEEAARALDVFSDFVNKSNGMFPPVIGTLGSHLFIKPVCQINT